MQDKAVSIRLWGDPALSPEEATGISTAIADLMKSLGYHGLITATHDDHASGTRACTVEEIAE